MNFPEWRSTHNCRVYYTHTNAPAPRLPQIYIYFGYKQVLYLKKEAIKTSDIMELIKEFGESGT